MNILKRAGAGCVYIECWDIDFFDFLDLRKKNGDDRRRAHELFLGINARNILFERLEQDPESNWTLFDPYDVPDLRNLYGEAFTKRYEEYEKDFKINPHVFNPNTRVVAVKEIFAAAISAWVENGTPFWHFIDNTNEAHQYPELGLIRQSNLCVTGDTPILTKEYGHTPIGPLVESGVKETLCWNGEEWSLTPIFKTSDEEELIEVKISNIDNPTKATPYHKWYIETKEGIVEKRTHELKVGDLLESYWDPETESLCMGHRIECITPLLFKEPTYCGTEPIRHKLIFNGVLTGNCTEVVIPTDEERTAVCNLGSINMSRFIDYPTYRKTLQVALRAVDNAIDLSIYPSKKAQKSQIENRACGIGQMGEAEYIATRGIEYGSIEHQKFLEEYFKFTRETLDDYTRVLAEEKGSCIIKGVRNAYLQAIAPNSTSGIFAGTTNSTEPVYSKAWVEGNKDNEYYMTAPHITKENKKYYQSAFEVDIYKQLDCTAIRQKYVDMAISTNIHMNSIGLKASMVKDIIVYAWKKKLKTLYYFKTKAVRNIVCEGCEN